MQINSPTFSSHNLNCLDANLVCNADCAKIAENKLSRNNTLKQCCNSIKVCLRFDEVIQNLIQNDLNLEIANQTNRMQHRICCTFTF